SEGLEQETALLGPTSLGGTCVAECDDMARPRDDRAAFPLRHSRRGLVAMETQYAVHSMDAHAPLDAAPDALEGRCTMTHSKPAPAKIRPHRAGTAGFTLVEMMAALTVVGIIGGMAIPRIDFDRYRADAAGRLVRAVMQSAQRSAIMRQTNVVVSFNLAANQM